MPYLPLVIELIRIIFRLWAGVAYGTEM